MAHELLFLLSLVCAASHCLLSLIQECGPFTFGVNTHGKCFCPFVVFSVSYASNLFCSSVPSFLPSFAFIDFLKIIYCIYSLLISFFSIFLVVFLKSKEYNEHLKLRITSNLYHFSLSMIQKLCSFIPLSYNKLLLLEITLLYIVCMLT